MVGVARQSLLYRTVSTVPQLLKCTCCEFIRISSHSALRGGHYGKDWAYSAQTDLESARKSPQASLCTEQTIQLVSGIRTGTTLPPTLPLTRLLNLNKKLVFLLIVAFYFLFYFGGG